MKFWRAPVRESHRIVDPVKRAKNHTSRVINMQLSKLSSITRQVSVDFPALKRMHPFERVRVCSLTGLEGVQLMMRLIAAINRKSSCLQWAKKCMKHRCKCCEECTQCCIIRANCTSASVKCYARSKRLLTADCSALRRELQLDGDLMILVLNELFVYDLGAQEDRQ